MSAIRLLGISGSLRNGSFSTAILETLADHVPGGGALSLHSLGDIPLYNQDLDTEQALAPVAAFRDAIAQADGVVIATPEYNYGVPGVLKNALDWASRPYGAAALIGKPVVTMSSSFAFTGGVRAQAQLNETLLAIGTRLVIRPQVVIGEVHTKVEEGRLTDKASLDFALAAVADLVRAIEASRAPAMA